MNGRASPLVDREVVGASGHLSVYLSVYLSSICLSVVYLSICLSVYLSICLFVCLSICLLAMIQPTANFIDPWWAPNDNMDSPASGTPAGPVQRAGASLWTPDGRVF